MKNYKIFILCLLICLFGSGLVHSNSDTTLFTKEQILKFSKKARPELVEALVENQQYFKDAGITTPLRLAHFFAQVATETGGMRRIDENMNYSAKRLVEVFPRRVTQEKAKELEYKPVDIANWVYGNRLGNGEPETNDGWSYRGSGFIQLTGRENFRNRGIEINLPLEEKPEMVRQPKEGLHAAIAYWIKHNINNSAENHDIKEVRRKINPPLEGFHSSKMWFRKIGPAFGLTAQQSMIESDASSEKGSDMEDASAILESLGFMPSGSVESGSLTEETFNESLRKYQKSRGLSETGILDDDTFYAITDPQEWKADILDRGTKSAVPNSDSSVASKINSVTDGNTEELPTLNPNEGSGNFDKDKKLSGEELTTLAESDAAYSEYEMATGKKDQNGNFVPFSIIEPDERTAVIDTTSFPARAVVQMNFVSDKNDFLCSGSMISPDTVLTAGHCVHSGTESGHFYSNFKLYPGRNTGSIPFGECGAIETFALEEWVKAKSSSEAREYDLGAIKLNCKIGNETGWFGVKVLPDTAENVSTTVHGYAGDKTPVGRQWISEGYIIAMEKQKGFYQNDTAGGMSGSPVYSEKDYRIIGVHTNGMHNGEPWKSNNAFTKITPKLLKEISNWINSK